MLPQLLRRRARRLILLRRRRRRRFPFQARSLSFGLVRQACIRARAEEHPPEPRERGILLLQQPDEVEQGAEQAVEQLEVLLAEAAAPEPIAQSFNLRPAG